MGSILIKIVFLIYFVLLLDATKFRCDYKFHTIGWFKYNVIPMTWRDARLQCHLEGAELASPTTTSIKDIMQNAVINRDIFTGIHANFSKGQFHSIDGIPLALIPHTWADNEPDNKNDEERCLALNSDGKMSDVNCDEPRNFICYRENSDKDVNICGTLDPEYHYDTRTSKCYKFHTKPRQFHRAHFACSAEGAHLAVINNEEESKVIREIFAKHPGGKMLGNFWKDVAYVGFHNWGESQDWTTVNGQSIEEAGFDKFSGGQPDNFTEGEYCGSVFRNGQFNDLWCEKHFAFICEKKTDDPPVCDSSDESIGLDPRFENY